MTEQKRIAAIRERVSNLLIGREVSEEDDAARAYENTIADLLGDLTYVLSLLDSRPIAQDGARAATSEIVELCGGFTTKGLPIPDEITAIILKHCGQPHPTGEAGAREWQPIKSAPKNGKVILGWCDSRICTQGVVKAVYSQRKDIWVSPDGAEGYDLTHWMPLPKPPADSLHGGDEK